jgi:hypothetical protein
MWSSFFPLISVTAWIVCVLMWAVLVAAVFWGITRLLPRSPRRSVPTGRLLPRQRDRQAHGGIAFRRRAVIARRGFNRRLS